MQNEKSAHEKPAAQDSVLSTQHQAPNTDSFPQNLQNPTFAHEKTAIRWQRLQAEILAHKELIAQDGCLAAIWKSYRGKRLGPYYRVEFRENRATRTIYIGRDENLATMASALIDELKQPREQQRILRQLRRTIWAGLRRSLREAEIHAAPLGYRRRGFNFHKQK